MEEFDQSRFPFLGSLLMVECASRDQHGWPYQVGLKLRPGGHGTEDLVRDNRGRVLAWTFDEHAQPTRSERGPHVQQIPPDVSDAAEQWLRRQLSAG